MIKDISLRVSPRQAAEASLIEEALLREMGGEKPNAWRVVRRSVDARGRKILINLTVRVATAEGEALTAPYAEVDFSVLAPDSQEVVIVGAGPGGLFAGLKALSCGIRPIILERGRDVDTRRLDLARMYRQGKVDTISNYCFGEGGAGAYSDGKLYTRSKKRGNVREVLDLLVQHGASPDILVDAHPHIGSDKLPQVIKNIRNTIIRCGGEMHYETLMTHLIIEEGVVHGVVASDGKEYRGPVVLATGHSARDVYYSLHDQGVKLECKGLAMGVRLEHPQALIDSLQYHNPKGRGPYLPPAEYSFVTQSDGRGVYSFCMCPGGVIVSAASAEGENLVNGMSASARAGRWANSGMVVEIRPGDFPEYTIHGPFELLKLQEDLERKFYEASKGTLKAPAQRMTDFVMQRASATLPRSSYVPGLIPMRLDNLLPSFIASRLSDGFRQFDQRRNGFLSDEGVMVGLESRTSSPVRIPRDEETMMHVELKDLYPVGEGAGYAGGIVSAAVDGVRAIERLASRINVKEDEIN